MVDMRKIRLLLFLLVLCTAHKDLAAQSTQSLITGKIVAENQPLRGATVILMNNDVETLKVTSDINGHFKIGHSGTGVFKITVTHTGYQTFQSEPFSESTKDFPQITLITQTDSLKSVSVQATTRLIETDGNSIIYNVAASIDAQGSNALEVLKKSPGVFIEREVVITLNGKPGTLVLIDGRPTHMSGKDLVDFLRSMPSSNIKSIELIANPPPKYDASGTGGIINIKTNKSPFLGFSGTATAGASYGQTLKHNEDLTLSFRNRNLNIFFGFNQSLGNWTYEYGSERIQKDTFYNSLTYDVDKRQRMSLRLGADYNINKQNILGFLVTGNYIYGGGITQTETGIGPLSSPKPEETLTSENDYYFQSTDRYNFNLNYRHESKSGQVFNIDADYGWFDKGNKNLQSNIYKDKNQVVLDQSLYRTLNTIDIDLKGLKADYSTPLWKGTFETGAKYSDIRSNNTTIFFHVFSNRDSLDNRRTNDFHFTESIFSAHANYKKMFGKWNLQGGIRMERSPSEGRLFEIGNNAHPIEENKRVFTNFFPFFSVAKTTKNKSTYSFVYSRRIDRPLYQDLNPFVYLLDELSFWKGNPFLQPQLTDRFTLQYVYKNSTVASLNYAHTSRYFTRITDSTDVNKIVMYPENGGKQNNISFVITHTRELSKWWSITTNGTLYRLNNIIALSSNRNYHISQTAWRIGLQQRFKLPWKLAVEANTSIQSKRLGGANEIAKGTRIIDLALQRKFSKDKFTVRLAVSDVFKGSPSNSVQTLNGFYLRTYGYYESRQIRINVTYKFADRNSKSPRVRQSALEAENSRIR